MKNIPTYLKDSYKKKLNTLIKSVSGSDDRVEVILKDTIFYPEGGGQPCDQGSIKTDTGEVEINEVKLVEDEIVHYGKLEGELEKDQEAQLEIDWDRRYKYMQIHTAGHVIDEALYRMGLSPDKLIPVKGSHGKKPYIEYKIVGDLKENLKKELEKKVDELIEGGEKISVEFVDKNEIEDIARVVPKNLPENKPLRVVSMGDEKGMPDGGTLLKNTKDLYPVEIVSIEENELLKINYKVEFKAVQKDTGQDSEADYKFEEVDRISESIDKDFDIKNEPKYSELKKKYLGSDGIIKQLIKKIKDQPNEKKPSFGKQVNLLKSEVERRLEDLKKQRSRVRLGKALNEDKIDVTAPFAVNTSEDKKPELKSEPGTLHPLTSLGEKAVDIFRNMGFSVEMARRLDSDYYNFTALNIPEGHPARDMWDTFWTEDDLIPLVHTSAMQNRVISRKKFPVQSIFIGRCMRNDATDASHEHTFYQLEGVYVDKGITLADLFGTLTEFVNNFYGKKMKTKIQPSYFPFVEPGLEFMLECTVCGQSGCSFCSYSGWVEVIPCGPIHPNVLKHAGVDPEEYSGFAWGLGYDRLVMLQAQIEDIRHLHGGNIKFLEQFK